MPATTAVSILGGEGLCAPLALAQATLHGETRPNRPTWDAHESAPGVSGGDHRRAESIETVPAAVLEGRDEIGTTGGVSIRYCLVPACALQGEPLQETRVAFSG